MEDLATVDAMQVEWEAWRRACSELEDLGISVNDEHKLVHALKLWGEELAKLRRRQTSEVCARALSEAREA